MKLIISLILFIITTQINSILSINIADQFVNLVAYNDAECQGTPTYGYGFTTVTETCITFDFSNSFIFRVGRSNVSWVSYENGQYYETCTVPNSINMTFPINSCIPSNLITVAPSYGKSETPFYYKLTVSSVPYIPLNSYVITLMSGECESDNVLMGMYFINNTAMYLQNQLPNYYYCSKDDNNAYTQVCQDLGIMFCNNPIETQYLCFYQIPAFYNSSSAEIWSTGCSSSNCCSGSCSGTGNSGSNAYMTSTSGTGGGYIPSNDDDNNNVLSVQQQKDTKSLQYSSSSSESKYYTSTYCS